MKKLLQILMVAGIATNVNAQLIEDTVSVGAGYANDVWYSLENGIVASAPQAEWHIAFDVSARSSELHFNTAPGYELRVYPGSPSNFETADTSDLSTWEKLYNNDDSWTKGAFSQIGTGHPDYGWGEYSMTTHNLSGIRFFIAKIGNEYRKIFIKELLSQQGIYTIVIDDLANTQRNTITFNKNEAAGRNFGYINILTGEILNREPDKTEWDLVFQRYSALQNNGTYATATGIRHNNNIAVAIAKGVDDPETFSDVTDLEWKSPINTIGYGWKSVNYETRLWSVVDSTVYFVKDTASGGDTWRIVFRDFGGNGNGNNMFGKEKLEVSTGIADRKNNINLNLSLYPNPAAYGQFTIAYDVQKAVNRLTLDIIDLSGRTVYSQQLSPAAGFRTQNISAPQLSSGMYIVRVGQDGNGASQKLIIK